MDGRRPNRNDIGIASVLGTLLIVGVSAAAAVILPGGVLHLMHNGASKTDFTVFMGAQKGLRSFREIFAGALSLHSDGVVLLGVLVLMATPTACVAFSLAAFLVKKDRLYTLISFTALAIIVLGFFV